MTPKQLENVGYAIYGATWQDLMSKDIRVSTRTIQRWMRKLYPVPPWVPDELEKLARHHRRSDKETIDRIIKEIRK